MRVSEGFVRVQWAFAQRVASVLSLPLEQALLRYTNMYIRLGLGRDFNAEDPVWQRFIMGCQASENPPQWAYDFYKSRLEYPSGPALIARFGCFGYAETRGAKRLHIHFQPPSEYPPELTLLGQQVRGERIAELQAMRGHMRAHFSDDYAVTGVSWLYNLSAYRTLFSESYQRSLYPTEPRYHSMTLWGQLLNRKGVLKDEAAFLQELAYIERPPDLQNCFQFPVWRAQCDLRDF